jgi:hypothetical protein
MQQRRNTTTSPPGLGRTLRSAVSASSSGRRVPPLPSGNSSYSLTTWPACSFSQEEAGERGV